MLRSSRPDPQASSLEDRAAATRRSPCRRTGARRGRRAPSRSGGSCARARCLAHRQSRGVERGGREEQREVGERVVEEDLRSRAREVTPQQEREREEHDAERSCGDGVERAEPEADDERERDQHDRVEDDLPRRLAVAAHDREHRHACSGVRVLDHHGQRPEVRGRPEEHDEEQPERRKREAARRRRVADERRYGARGPADDDVLRRRALEPARVDDDVEERCRRARARAVRRLTAEARSTNESAERTSPNSSACAGETRPDATGRLLGPAPHEDVDVAVEDVVQRRRRRRMRARGRASSTTKRPRGGTPCAPTNIPAAPVMRSSDMMRGFVSVR